jgi:hypothetical protein
MAATQKEKADRLIARIGAGVRFMAPYVKRHSNHARRYVDSVTATLRADGEERMQATGIANYIAVNLRHKVAAIAFSTPDFIVSTDDPGAAEVVREFLKASWRKGRWARTARRVLLDRCMSGLGCAAVVWSTLEGVAVEYVRPEDVSVDPNTTDALWQRPRWAARLVAMPMYQARQRYGRNYQRSGRIGMLGEYDGNLIVAADRDSDAEAEAGDEDLRPTYVWVYWDAEEEIEIDASGILNRGPNLYKRVPLHFLPGDVTPVGEFPDGDYDTAWGLQDQAQRLANALNAAAREGVGRQWLNRAMLDEADIEKLLSGSHQGPVMVTGMGQDAGGYWTPQPLSPAILDAMQRALNALDAAQGVTEYDRGVVESSPEFATQAVMMQRRSGARSVLLQKEFEAYVDTIANEVVRLTQEFGLDPAQAGPIDDRSVTLWKMLASTHEVRVVEESSSYRDPVQDAQTAMQMLTSVVQMFPAFVSAAQAGLVTQVPNLQKFLEDALRALRKRDLREYWVEMPQGEVPQGDDNAGRGDTVGGGPAAGDYGRGGGIQ